MTFSQYFKTSSYCLIASGFIAMVSAGVLGSSGNYTLQIGAFEQANNALNLRNYVANLGYPVEIVERGNGEHRIYQVLLGSFETEEQAQQFGENFKKSHGKLYRVVTKK